MNIIEYCVHHGLIILFKEKNDSLFMKINIRSFNENQIKKMSNLI